MFSFSSVLNIFKQWLQLYLLRASCISLIWSFSVCMSSNFMSHTLRWKLSLVVYAVVLCGVLTSRSFCTCSYTVHTWSFSTPYAKRLVHEILEAFMCSLFVFREFWFNLFFTLILQLSMINSFVILEIGYFVEFLNTFSTFIMTIIIDSMSVSFKVIGFVKFVHWHFIPSQFPHPYSKSPRPLSLLSCFFRLCV